MLHALPLRLAAALRMRMPTCMGAVSLPYATAAKGPTKGRRPAPVCDAPAHTPMQPHAHPMHRYAWLIAAACPPPPACIQLQPPDLPPRSAEMADQETPDVEEHTGVLIDPGAGATLAALTANRPAGTSSFCDNVTANTVRQQQASRDSRTYGTFEGEHKLRQAAAPVDPGACGCHRAWHQP